LKELQAEMPNLTLEEIEYTSTTGAKLSMANSITYPPAVFLDGKLIAKGKVDANALIQAIHGNTAIIHGGS
jgi:predicted thioredoxin/glutaredoxin